MLYYNLKEYENTNPNILALDYLGNTIYTDSKNMTLEEIMMQSDKRYETKKTIKSFLDSH